MVAEVLWSYEHKSNIGRFMSPESGDKSTVTVNNFVSPRGGAEN